MEKDLDHLVKFLEPIQLVSPSNVLFIISNCSNYHVFLTLRGRRRNSLNGEERRFENSSRVYTSSPLTPGVREQSDSTTCNSGKHRDKKF